MVLQKSRVYNLNHIYSVTNATELNIKMAVLLKFNCAHDGSKNNKPTTSCIDLHQSGSAGGGGGGSGIPVYPKKKHQNTQNSSKYTQNYTQLYFIPEIQRKWYTEYPYLSCNIPSTRFKKPLYTVYPKALADPDQSLKQIDMIPLICQSYIQYLFLAYK